MDLIKKIYRYLIGDSRLNPVEQRLLNAITLLNGISSLGGTFSPANHEQPVLMIIHLASATGFFSIYYLSRFRKLYSLAFWPTVLLMVMFLGINFIFNAGINGGAHYYLLAAFVIAVILAKSKFRIWSTFVLFLAVTLFLIVFEMRNPDLIIPHMNMTDRYEDVMSNFLFVQILIGVIILILMRNLNIERDKSEQLLQLETCFYQFDEIITQHNLEKIKTIGDSYMAAGGLPNYSSTHAVDMVLAALEMQSISQGHQKINSDSDDLIWRHRIGYSYRAAFCGCYRGK